MAGFLKILFRNLLDGPSTDPFPFGETFSPARIRGKVKIDPNLCMGCGMCVHSCTAKAINISPLEDDSGYTITVWRNSCCLCASCRHYCTTGAVSIIDDWHLAHPAEEKYSLVEQHTIKYEPCAACGELMRPLPPALTERLYASNKEIDPEKIRRLCPKCRQIEDASNKLQKAQKASPKADQAAPGSDGADTGASTDKD